MNHNISNIISLIIGAGINYLLQCWVFSGRLGLDSCVKFITGDIILLTYASIAFFIASSSEMNLSMWSDTIKRIVISMFGFLIISYPMRKYYIFV
jgi:putative flippase GtrA